DEAEGLCFLDDANELTEEISLIVNALAAFDPEAALAEGLTRWTSNDKSRLTHIELRGTKDLFCFVALDRLIENLPAVTRAVGFERGDAVLIRLDTYGDLRARSLDAEVKTAGSRKEADDLGPRTIQCRPAYEQM